MNNLPMFLYVVITIFFAIASIVTYLGKGKNLIINIVSIILSTILVVIIYLSAHEAAEYNKKMFLLVATAIYGIIIPLIFALPDKEKTS